MNNANVRRIYPFLLGVPATVSRQFVTVDVTQLVKNWVTGAATNFGVQISAAALASTTAIVPDSKENQTTSHPAFLDVALQSVGPAGPAYGDNWIFKTTSVPGGNGWADDIGCAAGQFAIAGACGYINLDGGLFDMKLIYSGPDVGVISIGHA